jgi:hypothetical protein
MSRRAEDNQQRRTVYVVYEWSFLTYVFPEADLEGGVRDVRGVRPLPPKIRKAYEWTNGETKSFIRTDSILIMYQWVELFRMISQIYS